MYTYLIIKNNEYALWIILRESILVVLNSYITIFSIIKYQNVTYNSRVKTIFFSLHSYRATLAMHGSQNYILVIFILISLLHCYFLCIHSSFTHFFFFFYITFTRLYIIYAFTLLLFFYSYILSFLIYCFFICAFTLLL